MLLPIFIYQSSKRFLRKLALPRLRRFGLSLIAVSSAVLAPQALAGEADVVKVKAQETRAGVWRFSVSLRHDDTGWNHYANNWEVLSPDGEVLATRVLGHPHVNEQPFTRGLSSVKIPTELAEVIIRARDSVHGYGGQEMRVDLATGRAEIIVQTTGAPEETLESE